MFLFASISGVPVTCATMTLAWKFDVHHTLSICLTLGVHIPPLFFYLPKRLQTMHNCIPPFDDSHK
jgi:hypothetical protein